MQTLEPAQSTPPEPSGGPSTAKMPSEKPVLSSTTVVWGEWAAWPLGAPGGYFYFPDNKDTHVVSGPSPFSLGPERSRVRVQPCEGGVQGGGAGSPAGTPT